MQGKLTSTKSDNLGPFASQTIAIVGESDFGFTEKRSIYVSGYLNRSPEEVQKYFEDTGKADQLFNAIVGYSVKIVTLSESDGSEQEQIERYAEYVSRFRADALAKIGATPEDQRVLVQTIREQKTYLDALQVAQPLVDAVAERGESLLFGLETSTNDLVALLDTSIEEDHEELLNYTELLEHKRNQILLGLQRIFEYEDGDDDALDRLKKSKLIRSPDLQVREGLSEKELRKIEDHLVSRLESLTAIAEKIEPDWERYRATHVELDTLHALVLGDIRRARLALLSWKRAHKLMAAGKIDSAEWFDLYQAPTTLLKLGAKTVL